MVTAKKRSLERELKFTIDRGFSLPALRGTKIPAHVFTSTYYDTGGYRLAQNGLTLRYRTKAGSGSWQLKLPMGLARLEVEFAGDHRRPPEALTRILVAHLRREPLKPIARLRTRRHGVRVRGDAGFVADVTVDAVDVVRAGKVVRHFKEVEAELIEGDERGLHAIERALGKAGARKSGQRPKVFEALGLVFPAPKPARVRDRPSIGRLKSLMQAQMTRVLVQDVGVRLETDPEHVHQMRVAIRRLRAWLRAARPILAANWADDLRDELRWIGNVLGRSRDLDVLVAHVRDERGRLPASGRRGCTQVVEVLERERRVSRDALLGVLESHRYLALLERLEAAVVAPFVANPNVPLQKIARAAFQNLRHAVRKGGADPADATLHRIRIKGKRSRHAAELAGAGAGKTAAARFSRRVKDLQDLLGEHHDAVVAGQRLRRLRAAQRDGLTAIALDRLIERQGERRKKVRTKWRDVWSQVKKAGKAAWPET